MFGRCLEALHGFTCNVVTAILLFPTAYGHCAAMLAGMNQMKERNIAGAKKYCFTVVPVAACPAGCIPVAHAAKMVGMHCLRANKMSTARWVRQHNLRVLHEFEWKHADIFEAVQVPTACAPAA